MNVSYLLLFTFTLPALRFIGSSAMEVCAWFSAVISV